jgi:hypothetical protein
VIKIPENRCQKNKRTVYQYYNEFADRYMGMLKTIEYFIHAGALPDDVARKVKDFELAKDTAMEGLQTKENK